MKAIIEMAREAGLEEMWELTPRFVKRLERFAALVRADEREACAKVAERLWQEFQDTKNAHERLSPAPFRLENFGFNQSTIQQSQIIADNIRARGQA